jgi:hypothetical protein
MRSQYACRTGSQCRQRAPLNLRGYPLSINWFPSRARRGRAHLRRCVDLGSNNGRRAGGSSCTSPVGCCRAHLVDPQRTASAPHPGTAQHGLGCWLMDLALGSLQVIIAATTGAHPLEQSLDADHAVQSANPRDGSYAPGELAVARPIAVILVGAIPAVDCTTGHCPTSKWLPGHLQVSPCHRTQATCHRTPPAAAQNR